MHKFSVTKSLPYTVKQIYDLILDVEKYPEFLPWCAAGRVVETNEENIIADLVISFKAFSEQYRSKISLSPPTDGYAAIDVEMIEGPFKYLSNFWRLKEISTGVEIDFYVDFAFKSVILDKILGLVFESASKQMIDAFEIRAQQLYGSG